jgi:hypothetical protein
VRSNWDWQEPYCRELFVGTRLYHISRFQLGEDEFLFVDDGLELWWPGRMVGCGSDSSDYLPKPLRFKDISAPLRLLRIIFLLTLKLAIRISENNTTQATYDQQHVLQ